ncbi:MAG: catalase-related domain-containing protein, partial [Xanthobacteraceae bacterium]
QQQVLFENTARAMGDARLEIKQRHVANCTRADPAYGTGVAKALGLETAPWTKQPELID